MITNERLTELLAFMVTEKVLFKESCQSLIEHHGIEDQEYIDAMTKDYNDVIEVLQSTYKQD